MRRRQSWWMMLLVVVVAVTAASLLLLAASQSAPLQRPRSLPRLVSMEGVRAVPLACARSRIASRPGTINGPPVQFIHLAKSGGTTIKNGLRRWANSNDIRVSQTYMGFAHYQPEVSNLRLWKHGLFQGHRGWGWSQGLATNALRVVMLREPVSRLISLFDYVKRSRSMFRRNSTGLFWDERSLDQVAAHYNHTRETAFDSLLPDGDACEADKAFHHALMHVLMYLAGFEYVWGPGPRSGNRVVPQRKLAELALTHVRECDVVAIFPGFETQLVPQLRMHLHWVPRDAAGYFALHAEKVATGMASTPSEATLGMLKRWLADEEEVFAEARRVAESRTTLARACQGATL